MPLRLDDLTASTTGAWRAANERAQSLVEPVIRLGVTGLSGAGKTVFITALVQSLSSGARLPLLRAAAEGRLERAYLTPQPDDTVPRFPFEEHLARLTAASPTWPDGTRSISELRLTLEVAPETVLRRLLGLRRLHLDIVDYPGEWLLDLALLDMDFQTWCQWTLAAARQPVRAAEAADFLEFLASQDAGQPPDEPTLAKGTALYRHYLTTARQRATPFAGLSPGRMLLPTDLDGSPALTFWPIDRHPASPQAGTLAGELERRYRAYVSQVVRPFYRDHFARLDRQIVLVDVLSALNLGPEAVGELAAALEGILKSFRPGANSLLSRWFSPRIDRIVFAATKADHLHQSSHDRLQAILDRMVTAAAGRAHFEGAMIRSEALAAIRTTREAETANGGKRLQVIVGTPLAGEHLGQRRFDGQTEIAIYPGELPADPERALSTGVTGPSGDALDVRFLRFRPPVVPRTSTGRPGPFPHIRLDRVIDFLIGDRLP
ncbi:MAG: YcjX family protein [Hyphomicrobiaceae bacterium]